MITRPAAATALIGLLLGGCVQTAATPPAPPPGVIPGVTPSTFHMPGGTGCAAEIARFRAVLRNDVDTGNVGQGVFDRASQDLARGDAACAAGRDHEGLGVLAATKSRFGYR